MHDDLPRATRLMEPLLQPLGANGGIDRCSGIDKEAHRFMPDAPDEAARPGEQAKPLGVTGVNDTVEALC
jgi:hypothetical protein